MDAAWVYVGVCIDLRVVLQTDCGVQGAEVDDGKWRALRWIAQIEA